MSKKDTESESEDEEDSSDEDSDEDSSSNSPSPVVSSPIQKKATPPLPSKSNLDLLLDLMDMNQGER